MNRLCACTHPPGIWYIAAVTHVQPVFAAVWLCTFPTIPQLLPTRCSEPLFAMGLAFEEVVSDVLVGQKPAAWSCTEIEGHPCATLMHCIYLSPFFMSDSPPLRRRQILPEAVERLSCRLQAVFCQTSASWALLSKWDLHRMGCLFSMAGMDSHFVCQQKSISRGWRKQGSQCSRQADSKQGRG